MAIRTVRILGLASLVAAPLIAFAVPATADGLPAASANVHVFQPYGKAPLTDIEGRGAGAHFDPAKIRDAMWTGPTQGQCTTKNESVAVDNTTAKVQTVTYNGAAFLTLQPDTDGGICFWGSGKYKFDFGLAANPHAELVVLVR